MAGTWKRTTNSCCNNDRGGVMRWRACTPGRGGSTRPSSHTHGDARLASPMLAPFSHPTSDTCSLPSSPWGHPSLHHPPSPRAPLPTFPLCLSLHGRSTGAKPQPGEGRLCTDSRKSQSCVTGLTLCPSHRVTGNLITCPVCPLSHLPGKRLLPFCCLLHLPAPTLSSTPSC